MRDIHTGKTPRGRRGNKGRAVDLSAFPVSPTRRAGQFINKRYQITALLGSGATSNVYLCVDTHHRQTVVVKQLTNAASTQEELRRRFLSEAEALSQLNHPHIVRVFDYGAPITERPYLVMEALCGESLASLLSRCPKPPVSLALLVARQTALGLEAAHALGVVHRDIKPDNLFLLGPVDEPFCVKIIDFGMAKIPQSNGSSGVNTVLGTVEYMAPEQVMADPVDARTDVYGLGILLFRLFTGRLPFESPEGMELLTHQLFSQVPPTSSSCEELSPWLEQVVARATCKHPDNRHQTMTDLIAQLDDARNPIGDEPEPFILPVEPDVYEPQNPKGREIAGLLAERYQSIVPPALDSSVDEPEPSLVSHFTLDGSVLEPFLDSSDLELLLDVDEGA